MIPISREYLASYLAEHKSEFQERFGVCRIGLFGSVVRGRQTAESDIDIAIEMVPDRKTLRNFLAFKRYLEQEFQRPVDLGIESALKKTVKDRIKGEIVYV